MRESPLHTPMSGRDQPDRQTVAGLDRLTILEHPLASNLVSVLRNIETPAAQFEQAIHELSRQLVWLATSDEPLRHIEVTTFSGGVTPGTRLARRIAALVILRAGLSIVPPLRSLIPEAPIYQVGIKRDEATLAPALYYSNLEAGFRDVEHLLILDPMLATGGSACLAVRLVRNVFDGEISFLGLIGAPIGVAALLDADPHIRVFLAALDERLNDRGYIVPGLGDAGDRLFGTN